MPITSSAFLILSLALAVLFGAHTQTWTWGPAMGCLIVGMAAALVALLKQPSRMLNGAMLVIGGLCAAWFSTRALMSPVKELGDADLMLLAACLGGFICVLAIQQSQRAQWVLTGGIAALLLANLIVMAIQIANPGYRPLLFNSTGLAAPTGFLTHYNYAANYLLVSSIWVLGHAWGSRRRVVQIGLGLLGTLGVASIWWTGSRGGLLAAIVALACFGLVILIEAKRRKARWFPAAAVAIPFVALILLGLLINGWAQIQQARGSNDETAVSTVLDNVVRLNYIDIAFSCISNHWVLGGGSQSFAWECFLHWNEVSHGGYYTKPEHVHNEWLQAATDYGLIGFGLVFGLMMVVGISAVLRMCFEPKSNSNNSSSPNGTAMRLAGLAGLMGSLTQCNFSFLFHLMPGALLLGMCLAATCQWRSTEASAGTPMQLQRGLLGLVGLFIFILITPLAWKGTRVLVALWPSHYSKQRELHAAEKLGDLSEVIKIWPQASLLMQRGFMHHGLALAGQDDATQVTWTEKALADYAAAQELHPFLPETAINSANLLSKLGRNEEAEQAYAKAIELQGGMEPTFRGHYHLAAHLMGRGTRELQSKMTETALAYLEEAAEHIELATMWYPEARVLQISIHEALGLAYELNGMPDKALASYEHAATIHYGDGRGIFFRSALLQAELANRQLLEREPAKALALFVQARQSVDRAAGRLPEGFTPEQRDTFVRKLDESIQRLREIGIEEP